MAACRGQPPPSFDRLEVDALWDNWDYERGQRSFSEWIQFSRNGHHVRAQAAHEDLMFVYKYASYSALKRLNDFLG